MRSIFERRLSMHGGRPLLFYPVISTNHHESWRLFRTISICIHLFIFGLCLFFWVEVNINATGVVVTDAAIVSCSGWQICDLVL